MNIKDLLLPYLCVCCQLKSDQSYALCAVCESRLPEILAACQHCGLPLPVSHVCANCQKKPPCYRYSVIPYRYEPPIDEWIIKLKFQQQLQYADLLGSLLAKKIKTDFRYKALPELIIPVPLHRKRLQQRGFNQAREIAEVVAKKLAIPIDNHLMSKVRHTLPQSDIIAPKRAKNLSQAFSIKNQIHTNHIAIIDDVATTGATLNEISKLFAGSAVNTISVWCCARTILRN